MTAAPPMLRPALPNLPEKPITEDMKTLHQQGSLKKACSYSYNDILDLGFSRQWKC